MAASSRATARRIGIVLRAPTQIDTPFFRYVTTRLHGELNVIYTRGDQLADRIFDAELGREISWGIDLLDGYPYSVLPRRGRLAWLLRELRRRTLRPAGCERIQRAGADHGGGCSEARVHSGRTSGSTRRHSARNVGQSTSYAAASMPCSVVFSTTSCRSALQQPSFSKTWASPQIGCPRFLHGRPRPLPTRRNHKRRYPDRTSAQVRLAPDGACDRGGHEVPSAGIPVGSPPRVLHDG